MTNGRRTSSRMTGLTKMSSDCIPSVADVVEDCGLEDYIEAYEYFEYDASAGAYVTKGAVPPEFEREHVEKISIKISGGKISYIDNEGTYTDDNVTVQGGFYYQFYDYGTTSITLPKNFTEGGNASDDGNGGNRPGEVTPVPSDDNTVNEKQWEAALSDKMFVNYSAESTMYGLNSTDESERENGGIKIDSKNKIFSMSGGYEDEEDGNVTIVDTENIYEWLDSENVGYSYTFTSKTGKWTREELTESQYEEKFTQAHGVIQMMNVAFSQMYSVFAYDPATRSYFLTVDPEDNGTAISGPEQSSIVLKFVNGKLTHIKTITSGAEETYVVEITLHDYGTTTVDKPKTWTDADDQGGSGGDEEPPISGMTADEWKNMCAEMSTNFTLTINTQSDYPDFQPNPVSIKFDRISRRIYIARSEYRRLNAGDTQESYVYVERIFTADCCYIRVNNDEWRQTSVASVMYDRVESAVIRIFRSYASAAAGNMQYDGSQYSTDGGTVLLDFEFDSDVMLQREVIRAVQVARYNVKEGKIVAAEFGYTSSWPQTGGAPVITEDRTYYVIEDCGTTTVELPNIA